MPYLERTSTYDREKGYISFNCLHCDEPVRVNDDGEPYTGIVEVKCPYCLGKIRLETLVNVDYFQSSLDDVVTHRQIILNFSSDIKEDTVKELVGELIWWIEDGYDEMEHVDGSFIPRYKCRWCWEDVTKEKYASQEELCDECHKEWLGDQDL